MMTMSAGGPPCQARITPVEGRSPTGGGLLCSERQVITCAHVIGPQPEPVLIDFPFLAMHTPIRAEVVRWHPVNGDESGDVALLQLREKPPPGTEPVRLCDGMNIHGHRFRAYGYPSGHPYGVWANGRIVGPAGPGWTQLESDGEYPLQTGFSGAPVWTDIGTVVGLVTTVDRKPTLRAGFSIGTDILRSYCPELPPPQVANSLRIRNPQGREHTTIALRGDCIQRAKVTVGRQEPGYAPDIALNPGERISRDHCQLDFDRGHWWLRDNDSTNGTFLRRCGLAEMTRVTEPVRLRNGDVTCLFASFENNHPCYWELELVDHTPTYPVE